MTRLWNWSKEYRWLAIFGIVGILAIGFWGYTIQQSERKADRTERRLDFLDLQKEVLETARLLAIKTEVSDSTMLTGDSIRLENQYEIIAKLDTILIILREMR